MGKKTNIHIEDAVFSVNKVIWDCEQLLMRIQKGNVRMRSEEAVEYTLKKLKEAVHEMEGLTKWNKEKKDGKE